jgi:hypothetical protein
VKDPEEAHLEENATEHDARDCHVNLESRRVAVVMVMAAMMTVVAIAVVVKVAVILIVVTLSILCVVVAVARVVM